MSAPASWVARLSEILARGDDGVVLAPAFWMRALSQDVERVIGPAFQGSLDPGQFEPKVDSSVRPVDDDDRLALDEFRATCGSDWNLPEAAQLWRHGHFEEGAVTALAAYRPWSDNVGDPCVITRPDARSRGHGAAVTSAVVAKALEDGKLLLYQTLESNEPAVRIALSLGYERYANHVAVRLSRDSPNP